MTLPLQLFMLTLFFLSIAVLLSVVRLADIGLPLRYEPHGMGYSRVLPSSGNSFSDRMESNHEQQCPSKEAKLSIPSYPNTAFLNCSLLRNKKEPLLNIGPIHAAPFVIESHKLLLFVIRKVASREFTALTRRLMGLPARNMSCRWSDAGLVRLNGYAPNEAEQMLLSEEWTRAVFVRDPKKQILLAYLDKIQKVKFLQQNCCGRKNERVRNLLRCEENATKLDLSFPDFVQHIVPACPNYHWIPQASLLRKKEWNMLNYVGNFDRLEADGRRLLERIGAWEDFGKMGWQYGSIFHGGPISSKFTGANDRLREYYTRELEELVETLYEDDYKLSVLNLPRYKIFEKNEMV